MSFDPFDGYQHYIIKLTTNKYAKVKSFIYAEGIISFDFGNRYYIISKDELVRALAVLKECDDVEFARIVKSSCVKKLWSEKYGYFSNVSTSFNVDLILLDPLIVKIIDYR